MTKNDPMTKHDKIRKFDLKIPNSLLLVKRNYPNHEFSP
jgi:hypothetical protein